MTLIKTEGGRATPSPTRMAANTAFKNQLAARKAQLDATLPAKTQQIVQAFTPLQKEFDQRVASLLRSNGSPRTKFHALNEIMSDVRAVSAPFSACKAGCSQCCYQRVAMTQGEADAIGYRIGHAAKQLPASYKVPAVEAFSPATPCVFLKNNQCSIYDSRPFACRNLVNLDVDNLLCDFDNWELGVKKDPAFVGFPMQDPGPMLGAYKLLAGKDKVGDIRDFFPI